MKIVSMLIACCMVIAVALTVFAQTRDLDPVMKEVGPMNTGLTRGMADRSKSAADVAKDADKLHALFTETSAFLKGKNLEKAAEWANTAAVAAQELSKAAKSNDYEAMRASQAAIGKTCKTCHDVHREQLPDKTFKLKMQ